MADISDESLRRTAAHDVGSCPRSHALAVFRRGQMRCGRLLKSEVDRGPDFVRLANALSALYPKDSDEKRLLDAMLLAVPR